MEITNRGTTYYIPRACISGWELLSNFQSDNEGEAMPLDWDTEELKSWIILCGRMVADARSGLISLSSVHKLVDFMLPTSDFYLLYVENDLTDRGKRVEAFSKLGMCVAMRNSNGTLDSIYDSDRFLGYTECLQDLLDLPDEVTEQRDKLLKIPYMVLLGIIVNSRETNPLSIDWSDLKDTIFSQEAVSTYREVRLEVTEGSNMNLLRLFLRLPNITESNDLRILSGTPIQDPINFHQYIEQGWSTSRAIIGADIVMDEDELIALDGRRYSTESINKLIHLIGIQVETAPIECLAGIVKYMLGLGPILDINGDYTDLPENHLLPIFSLILAKSRYYEGEGRYSTRYFSSACRTLAECLGTNYLSICCGAVRRLLEYHSTINPEEIGRNVNWIVSTVDSDVYSFPLLLKKEDERLRIFYDAASIMLEVNIFPCGFTEWPCRE